MRSQSLDRPIRIDSIIPRSWLTAVLLSGGLAAMAGCDRAPAPVPAGDAAAAPLSPTTQAGRPAPPADSELAAVPARAKSTTAKSAAAPAKKKPAANKPALAGKPATGSTPSPADDATEAHEAGVERFVLFTPSGPLIVELEMAIDGESFRAARRELIEQVLLLADRDRDGIPTWEEVYSQPRGQASRLMALAGGQFDRKQFLRHYDTNQNGLVDFDEARRLVARGNDAGASFELESSTEHRRRQRESAVWKLLDTDEDGSLTSDEWAVAADRLRGCDADDDEVLIWSELDETAGMADPSMQASRAARLSAPAACRLGPQANWDAIVFAFAELCLDQGQIVPQAFALDPTLPTRLDADADGYLNASELRRLEQAPADLALVANFGQAKDLPAGVELRRLPAAGGVEPRPRHDPTAPLSLSLGDFSLRIEWRDRNPGSMAAAPDAEAQLAALDKDKNGYLEKSELEGNPAATLADFEAWDADGDGKVFGAELTAFFQRQQAPRRTALRVTARDDPDSLWTLVDADQDNRLSRAEWAQAADRLAALDVNGDGEISELEVPGSITLVVERGAVGDNPPMQAPARVARAPEGPVWFQHMDVNRDRQVSRREFPASLTQFQELDANGNGTIDLAEAVAADRPAAAP